MQTGKIPRLRLGMTHCVISNECERSFFSSISKEHTKVTTGCRPTRRAENRVTAIFRTLSLHLNLLSSVFVVL
jgi:hypothetical protein